MPKNVFSSPEALKIFFGTKWWHSFVKLVYEYLFYNRYTLSWINLLLLQTKKKSKTCKHCLGINNNFVVFFPINAHRHALISSINQVWKNCNLWHFFILTNHVNLQIFFNPENLLAKKNQLFPCLLLCSPLSITIYNKVDTRRGWEIQILHPYFILFGDQKKVCLFSKI